MLIFLIQLFPSFGNSVSRCSLIYSSAAGMVWNLSFLLLQLLYSNWHTTDSRSRVLFTYGHKLLDDSKRPYWIPFFSSISWRFWLTGLSVLLNTALAAWTIVNNWPFIFAGISSPWVHLTLIICRFIINRGFLSFHFLLTLFSPFFEI